MPTFINEENKFLSKNLYKLPKELVKHLKQTLAQYQGYSENDGYKRIKGLVDPEYNKRSDVNTHDGSHVSYYELKRIKHDLDKMNNKYSLERQFNGGDEMKNFVNATLNRERNKVKEVSKQSKNATRQKNAVKPPTAPTAPTSVDKNSTKVQENKTIHINQRQLMMLQENTKKDLH